MDDHMSIANFARATRISYLRGVRQLILHYQKKPEELTVQEVKAFLVYERDKKSLASSTLNLRVCGLKYYYRHIANRLDLVVKIPNPRIQKYNTEILTIEELKKLVRVCKDMRQVLILHMLYDTGIRVRELVRLRAVDFDKHNGTITILNSKGNKTRVVHYGDQLRDTLNKYVKARGSVPANTLLESYKEKDKPLSLRGVQLIVKRIVKRSGLKKRISPHTFRHTYAVHYLNCGGSLFHLQKLLGHSNITTTLHYIKYAKLPEARTLSVLDEVHTKG